MSDDAIFAVSFWLKHNGRRYTTADIIVEDALKEDDGTFTLDGHGIIVTELPK